ncbi:hypothetical protein ACI65C_006607 [Semiaphis heraclei]
MKKEQMNTIGQIELILSGEPRLRQHPKYAARKKRLNNIINDKCNRSLIDFLKGRITPSLTPENTNEVSKPWLIAVNTKLKVSDDE